LAHSPSRIVIIDPSDARAFACIELAARNHHAHGVDAVLDAMERRPKLSSTSSRLLPVPSSFACVSCGTM
jgi:hypothetical protein